MDDDQLTVGGSELLRWIVVAALVVAGIGLFFYFAPSTKPAVPPSVEESPR
jgi:multidrug efflux pump subunit AcrA (membrane-fusion protein)